MEPLSPFEDVAGTEMVREGGVSEHRMLLSTGPTLPNCSGMSVGLFPSHSRLLSIVCLCVYLIQGIGVLPAPDLTPSPLLSDESV